MIKKLAWLILFSAVALSTSSCEGPLFSSEDSLASIRERGVVQILTTERPLVFQKAGASTAGLEKELLQNFADRYNLRLEFIIKKSREELLRDLRSGVAQIAIDRFDTESDSEFEFLHGPTIDVSKIGLFCHKTLKIKSLMDLTDQSVLADTQLHQKLSQFFPAIKLVSMKTSTVQTVAAIQNKTIDCAILDVMEANWFVRSYLQVEYVQNLNLDKSITWFLHPSQNDLRQLLIAWFQSASREDEIMRIRDHYESVIESLSTRDIRKFRNSIKDDLVNYKAMFIDSGKEHELDWKLVAAVAYQESHWNPHARSFTGVRGLMQLTEDTARHVGIEDRNDPAQSVWGGSYYLRSLLDVMPTFISKRDRLALALAAYNSGLGHLKDVQSLAEARGMNPWSWRHLKQLYPLLEDESIAADLPMGAARGSETVSFVSRVQSYYNLLNSY